MNKEQDYVLGTHDEELDRLGLQHRVWKPRMIEAWTNGGITEGSRVVDLGCGPGFATIDLAEMVGPSGVVMGVERSSRFLDFARSACQKRGFQNVQLLEADLSGTIEFSQKFDAVWCRWVACFLPDLNPLMDHLRGALKPGGTAIFHEYVNYATWQTVPRSAGIERFAAKVMESWRASGGEPNIVFTLLPRLIASGFEIVETKPIIFAVKPNHFTWRWPSSFINGHVKRLIELGQVDETWGREVLDEFGRLESSPDSLMLTPMVLQIIARQNR